MKIKGTGVSPTLRIDEMSVSTSSSSSISPLLCLPPPVRSVHLGIEVFQWHIAANVTLRGINRILGVCWLPLQSSDAFDNVSTLVFDRVLVIVIPFHILESV
jgi:hypothetical protein